MKKITFLTLAVVLTLLTTYAQNLLNDPQKIVIDEARNRFIVSNYAGGGDLIIIDSMGNHDTFVENAGMIDGLVIVGDTIYGSGPYPSGKIRGYNLITGEMVIDLALDGVQHLSSFISDDEGIIYTSERFGDRIFKINPATHEYWVFAEGGGLDEPNGLLLEPENNRMLVCLDQIPPKIFSVSLSDSTVSLITTLNINGSDGIDKDPEGNYYITGYYLPGMYKCAPDFSGEPELVYEHNNMVYPTYNHKNNSFLVTLYGDDDWAEIPVEENILDEPESVVYDAGNDRYLVSSCGHGKIVQIDNLGQQSYFNTAVSYTLGLHVVGDTVYVSSNAGSLKGVAGFSLETRGAIFHTEIPEQELLNDITADNSGNLYITDCDADKIYKVSIENSTYSTFVSSDLNYPNGILFDEANNRLLVANDLLVNRPISAVNLEDATVSTIVETGISAVDGLTRDNYGNTYFSSWVTDKTYRYDETFTNPPEVVTEGHTDPADIFYNKQDDMLVVPNYSSNIVEFIPITHVGIRDITKNKLKINSIKPNPFTDNIKIEFSLFEHSRVNIDVYNISGNKILDLTDKVFNAGTHTIEWKGNCKNNTDLKSGVYFIDFITGKNKKSVKVIKQ